MLCQQNLLRVGSACWYKVDLLGGVRGGLRSSRSSVHHRLLRLLLLSGLACMMGRGLLRWRVLTLHGLACRVPSRACTMQSPLRVGALPSKTGKRCTVDQVSATPGSQDRHVAGASFCYRIQKLAAIPPKSRLCSSMAVGVTVCSCNILSLPLQSLVLQTRPGQVALQTHATEPCPCSHHCSEASASLQLLLAELRHSPRTPETGPGMRLHLWSQPAWHHFKSHVPA